jgi:arylsulfatase A-like enzyme
MGSYGYLRNTTPNIDQLAKEGIIFENALSQAPYTSPSIYTLLTSRNISKHEQDDKTGVIRYASVPEILKKNGYLTGAIIAKSGFRYLSKHLDHFNTTNVDHWSTPAEETTEKAINWVEEHKEKKFFLWLHYWDVHFNYIPPRPYNEMYSSDYQGFLREHIDIRDIRDNASKLTENDIAYIVSQYDGEIRRVDAVLGKLFRRLKELGLNEKTVMIIGADHGETLGERGYFGHSLYLYDELLRAPLIVVNPASDLKNIKITNQVRNLDIAPTILDALDIPQPESFEGTSLYEVISSGLNTPAFSRTYPPFENTPMRAFSSRGYKLITPRKQKVTKDNPSFWNFTRKSKIAKVNPPITRSERSIKLYDLRKDPNEQVNIADENPEMVQNLKEEIKAMFTDGKTDGQADKKKNNKGSKKGGKK